MKNYEIFLFRHGITDNNLRGEYTGITDPPLCTSGRQTISDFAQSDFYPNVGRVYTSPLARCIETAYLAYPAHGLGHGFHPIENLREYNFGEYEGKTPEQLSEFPEYSEWLKGGMESRPPGGESHAEFTTRCIKGIEEVFADMSRSEINKSAVITHAGVIVTLLSGCGLPKGTPADFVLNPGEGWLIRMSTYLWQKGNVFEIVGKLS